MISSSFFTRIPSGRAKQVSEYHFIDVGREAFHALAVALIDYFKSTAHIEETAAKKTLDRFFLYYPHYKSKQSQLTSEEQLHRLINSSRKSELVECMAFVLRQLAVDELYAHPIHYPEVFALFNRKTNKSDLRQPHTVLPSSALGALAQVLEVPLTLLFREPGKELAMKEHYPKPDDAIHKISKEGMIIQIQGTHYFPGVRNKEEFTFVGQLAIHPPEPLMETSLHDKASIDDIIDALETNNQNQLQAYTHWCHAISSMVETGELTKEQLLSLYIKFLPEDTKKAQSLIRLAQQKQHLVAGNSFEDSKQQLIELLVSALASWISVKEVNAEQLFDDDIESLAHESLKL